ncbi:hypothetical protein [Moraxella catarrhalis]|uniref:hypothetical protein n=1 Tax=Moraxella catarrhalis TaxID=480 RepID=UPI0007E458C1|nr:hypothetical protein [Moraxella catarrhalis]RKM33436.1 hypothetical protein D6D62_06390 [Moraxella catarrhalis]
MALCNEQYYRYEDYHNAYTIYSISPTPHYSFHIDKIGGDYLVMNGNECCKYTDTSRKALDFIRKQLSYSLDADVQAVVASMPKTLD